MSNSGGNDLVRKQVWAHDAKTGKTYLTTRWVKVDAGKEEERHTHTREDTARGLLSLADNIDKILNGTEEEKEALKQRFFKIADTPQFLKDIGLTGDCFTIKYGVISRHKGKDADHDFNADEWRQICGKITQPQRITRHNGGFNLFLDIKKNGKTVLVGVSVKSIGKNIEVNAVRTVFAKNTDIGNGEVVYEAKTKPLAQALLAGTNSRHIEASGNVSIPHSTQKSTLSWADIERMSKSIESHLVIYKGHFYIMRTRNIPKEVS